MKTLYVGGEHEVRCNGDQHYVFTSDARYRVIGLCDCEEHSCPECGGLLDSQGFHLDGPCHPKDIDADLGRRGY